MNSQHRKVLVRRCLRALRVLFVAGVITLALGIDLRYRAVRQLARAEQDFVAFFGHEALARVRTSLSQPPELAQRLTDAAASTNLSVGERRRLVKLTSSNASPDLLAPWDVRCKRLVEVMDHARHFSPIPLGEASAPPSVPRRWSLNESMGVINSVRACGLAAAARSERARAITAVELLGVFARSLQSWPLRLSLMVGLSAERSQLELVERLRQDASVEERSRLLVAISDEGPRGSHRDVIGGEMLYVTGDWSTGLKGEPVLASWSFRPFEAGAYVRDLLRFLKGDRRPPSWPDSEFLPSPGHRPQLEREQDQLAKISARRDAERRSLTP